MRTVEECSEITRLKETWEEGVSSLLRLLATPAASMTAVN